MHSNSKWLGGPFVCVNLYHGRRPLVRAHNTYTSSSVLTCTVSLRALMGLKKIRGAIAFLIAAECVLSEIAREVRVRGSFGEQLARGVQEQSEIRMLLFGNVGFS